MPLQVVIVGAGIGGLGAAIALTRAGHNVKIYEKSSFRNEVGAAIHLAPNASRVLKDWDCDIDKMDPVKCESFSVWDHRGKFTATLVVTEQLQNELGFQDEWNLVHRVDLHNALRQQAEAGFTGKASGLYLNCGVESVDPETGKVLLENGEHVEADVIIGADGVHSKITQAVTGMPTKQKSTGQSCFRFLIPMENLENTPLTKGLIDRVGTNTVNAFIKEDRRLVIYPCRSGKLMNCVFIHPEQGDQNIAESWQNNGSHDDLMKEAEDFSPELREICSLARDVKLWSLASRDPPTVFYKQKLALIGEAAHPTLPHQGQGGAQALEDAAALGALLTAETKVDEIPYRLRLYNEIRYERAVTMLFMSRVGDEGREVMMDNLRKYVPDAKMPANMFKYAWDSYPTKRAKAALASHSS